MKFANLRLAAPFLCLLALPACGKFSRLSEEEKTTSVSVGSLSNGRPRNGRSAPTMNGGLMIWGISEKQKVAIQLGDENQVAEKILKNGEWKFYAMGYQGPGELAGAISCGNTTKKLMGADTTVDITINATGCADPFFGGNAAGPVPIRVVTCNAFSTPADGSAACDGALARGDFHSFRIRLEASEPAAPGLDAPSAGFLSTACLSAPTSSAVSTTVPFPAGPTGNSPMKVSVDAYANDSCTGALTQYRFGNGLRSPATAGGPTAFFSGSGVMAGANSLYLVHGSLPAPTITGVSPPQGSWGGGTVITIGGTNFDAGTTAKVGGIPCTIIGSVSPNSLTCKTQKPGLTNPGSRPVQITRAIDLALANGPVPFSFVEDGFGDAGYGDSFPNAVVTTPFHAYSPNTLGSRSFHSYNNISAVGADNRTLTFRSPSAPDDFQTGDDILWHVSAASSDTACAPNGSLKAGAFGFSKLDFAGTAGVVLRNPLPATPVAANLASVIRNSGSNFCLMQIVRFPGFRNLTINAPGAGDSYIAPPVFNMASGYGGIIVLRVQDTLFLQGTADPSLNVSGAGHAGGGGAPGFGSPGDASIGSSLAISAGANAAGGGGATASSAAGGGASAIAAGGAGGNAPASGGIVGGACSITDSIPCIRFGGGGGSGDSAGGKGGGIALLYARKIDNLGASNNLNLFAAGEGGSSNATGGGGGGVAHVQVAELPRTSILSLLKAAGGAGFDGAKGSGGGGGGQITSRYCAATGIGTIGHNVDGGTGGAGAFSGAPGGNGTYNGESVPAGTSFCF